MASKVKLSSNFRTAIKAGDDAVEHAISEGTDAMDNEASKRISRAAEQRGYELDMADLSKEKSGKDGSITMEQWWWRFFEFGTVYIQAIPALGPGHRKGRKVVKDILEDDFEGWIRRKAGMR